jgi:hypothetical protein
MPEKIYNIEDNPKMLASFTLATCRTHRELFAYIKGLSHEIDFKTFEKYTELGLHVGCGWFFSFPEAPLMFK